MTKKKGICLKCGLETELKVRNFNKEERKEIKEAKKKIEDKFTIFQHKRIDYFRRNVFTKWLRGLKHLLTFNVDESVKDDYLRRGDFDLWLIANNPKLLQMKLKVDYFKDKTKAIKCKTCGDVYLI